MGHQGTEEQHRCGDRAGRPEQRASNSPLVPRASGMQSPLDSAELPAEGVILDFPGPRSKREQTQIPELRLL